MKPSLTDILCTQCGLCCDGTLLADVELAGRDESTALEILGLDIEEPDQDHGGLLLLPCRALKGTRCSIYPHRPECCRTFECRLLQEARSGVIGVEQAEQRIADALGRIERIKLLVVALGQRDERLTLKERCVEALTRSEGLDADPDVHRKRAELEAEMSSFEIVVQETFLGD